MRNRFIDLIHQEMASNRDVVFLTADMGINLVEKIEEDYPDRFFNVGIAEQNLIGIAAGLAESGFRPFAYTISNFITIRALEQIRNDVVLHELPVTLVGTSTGFDNGPLGPTHHMLDDWGALSSMPNLNIYCPVKLPSVNSIFAQCLSSNFPNYVRIAKGNGINDELTKVANLKNLVLSYGSAVNFAIEFSHSNNADYILVETLKPLQLNFDQIKNYENIIVVEDHFPTTGMYSQVCQLINETGVNARVISVAPKNYSLIVGKDFSDFL